MHNLFKRFWGRIRHTISDKSIKSEMLRYPVNLPEPENAETFLCGVDADSGRSCLINRGPDYEERNVLLSIIAPAYNVERYIKGCLDSILQQETSFPYEIIVVNDGSTDATSECLKKYKKSAVVRILHHENRGLSAARNTGIACSKGEYLCFVDSDDELAAGALDT